jgi:hypothetical protein
MDEPHGIGYYVVGGAIALLIVGFILFMFFIMFRGMYRALFWSRERLREEQIVAERGRRAMGSSSAATIRATTRTSPERRCSGPTGGSPWSSSASSPSRP